MSFLDRLMEHFAKINRRMKRWKRVISALSALVVFCTTYALILPAITLDKETASAQPGIEVAANEGNIEEAGSAVIEETVEEEPSFAEPAGPEETIEEDPEETADEGPEYLEDEGPEDDTDGENGHNEDAESEDSERDGDGFEDNESEAPDDSSEDEALPDEENEAHAGDKGEDDDNAEAGGNTTETSSAGVTETLADDIRTTETLSPEDLAAAIEAGEILLITEKTQLVYEYIDEEYEKYREQNKEENKDVEAGGNSDEKEEVDDGYFVYAEFDASAKLPEGVELQVREITEESDPELYDMYREKALAEVQDKYDENTGVTFAKFYDISFVYQGMIIEPSGDVKIRIEYKREIEVKRDEKVDAIHFDKENDEKPELIESEVNPDDKEKEEKDSKDANEDGEVSDPMKAVEFTSDRFSVYGVVGTGSLMATFLSADGNTYEVIINCDTDANIPADAELVVSEVEASDEEYEGYLASAAEAMNVSADKIAYAKLLDISIVKDGEDITPDMPVDVQIRLLDRQYFDGNESLNVVHYESEGERPVLVDGSEQDGVVSFAAEGFSVYGVFYTVDFHWEVDGKTYEFMLPGGGFVSFSELAELLGIADRTSGEETGKFTEDIEGVEFSDPEYLWAGKVEEESTVAAIRERNGLEVQYSSGLTEEQINAINSSVIEPGDWILISMQPFTSEESLIVTMKTGEVFTIRVTDAQISTNVLTADKKTYCITVTYSDAAGLPDGTGLSAEEILPDTEEYSRYLGRTWAEVNKGFLEQWERIRNNADTDEDEVSLPVNIDDARFFDLTFMYKGEEIEPKAPVQVDIRLAEGLSNDADEPVIGVVHFPSDKETGAAGPEEEKPGREDRSKAEIELIDPVETVKNADGSIVEFSYRQESFSAVGAYIGQKTLDAGMKPLDPAVALPKLTALRAGEAMPTLDPLEASKTLTPNTIEGQPDGTYTLSLSVKGDAEYWNQITKANVLIMMDRSTSMYKGNVNEGTAVPYDGPYQSGVSYYGICEEDKEFWPLNYSNGVWRLIRDGHDPEEYTGTVYVSSNRLQAEQAALDELVGALVDKNDPSDPDKKDIVEVCVASFASARGSELDGALTQNASGAPTYWNGTTETGWLTSYEDSDLYTAVHNRSVNNGTNWQDALLYAKELADAKKEQQPNEDVFIIFLTDGEPTAIYGENSKDNNGWGARHYDNPSTGGGSIYALGFAKHDGREDTQNEYGKAWDVQDIVDDGHKFFAIFTFNTDATYSQYLKHLVNYAYGIDSINDDPVETQDTPTSDAFYTNAKTIATLRDSFDNIFTKIYDTLSYGDVKIVDGLTTDAMSTTLVDGEADGMRYTVKDEEGNTVYTVTASGSVDDPDDVVFTIGGAEYKLSDENSKVVKKTVTRTRTEIVDGEEVEVPYTVGSYYSVTIGGIEYRMALAGTETTTTTTGEGDDAVTEEKRNLTWDLSPIGSLTKDYTYTAECIVWPKQEAYDYVAGLNNKLEGYTWDESIAVPVYDQEEEPHTLLYYKGGVKDFPSIVKYPDGVFSVLSNTEQKVYYSEVHSQSTNDVITSVSEEPHEEDLEYPDPMPLTSTRTDLIKEWSAERNPAEFAQYLYNPNGTPTEFRAEFDIYQEDYYLTDPEVKPYKTVSLGWDSELERYVWAENSPIMRAVYNGRVYRIGTRWSDEFAIATGLMLSEGELARLRLDPDDYATAVYEEDGVSTTYYILERGHDYHVVEEGNLGYEFDFIAPVFHPMLIDGQMMNIVFEEELNKEDEFTPDDSYTIKEITPAPGGIGTLVVENKLRAYINLKKIVVDTDGKTVVEDDDTKFTYELELESSLEPGPFEGTHVPWYGIDGLFYHTIDQTIDETTGETTDTYTYYQAEVTDPEEIEIRRSHTLTLKTESGEVYDAVCTDAEGNEYDGEDQPYIFDEDVVGPSWVTYEKDGTPVTIELWGNQMDRTEITDGGSGDEDPDDPDDPDQPDDPDEPAEPVYSANYVSATLQIRQGQTLSIANVPRGTEYTISEVPHSGYDIVNIRKEIMNGKVVESRDVYTGRYTISDLIVEDRDNNFIFTNKIHSTDITVKKVDENGDPLPGAVFALTKDEEEPATGTAGTGEYKFIDLKNGSYTLVETSAPAGYELIGAGSADEGKIATFTVNNGKIENVTPFNGAEWDPETLTFTVKNNVLAGPGSLTVRKIWLDEDGNLTDYDGTVDLKLLQWVERPEVQHSVTVTFRWLNSSNSWQTATTRTGTGYGGATLEWSWNSSTNSVQGITVEGGGATYESLGGKNYRLTVPTSNSNVSVRVDVRNSGYDPWANYNYGTNDYRRYLSIGNVQINSSPSAQEGPSLTGGYKTVRLGTDGVWAQSYTVNGDGLLSEDSTELPSTYNGNTCYYTIDEVNIPSGYVLQEITTDKIREGFLSAYNKKTERGSLAIQKLVADAIGSDIGDTSLANGKYNFTVADRSGTAVRYVQIRIHNGTVTYKVSNTEEISFDDTEGFGQMYVEGAIVDELVPGTYTITETGHQLETPGHDTEPVKIDVEGAGAVSDISAGTATLVVAPGDLPRTFAAFTNLMIRVFDVPVVKNWSWSQEDEGQVSKWDATFYLQYREMLVSGEPAADAQHGWAYVYEQNSETPGGQTPDAPTPVSLTIESTQDSGTDCFHDLPMYKIHDNGSVYRVIYAVDEVSYNVYGADDAVIHTWNKSTSGHLEAHYSPDYEQDAGELDQPDDPEDWVDWYTITLTNVESTKEILKDIDLSIEKTWEGDTDDVIWGDPANYAKFRLKRTYHEEYLDYNKDPDHPLDPEDLVTVRLVHDGQALKELVVPRGAPVYLTAVVKPGNTASLVFRKGNSTITLSGGDSSLTNQQFIRTSSPFAANTDAVTDTTLTVTFMGTDADVSSLAGGLDGIGFASFDEDDITDEIEDESFNTQSAGQEFTLYVGNEWQKDWVELPQVVVETATRTVDGITHTFMKTIVYSYYLEETKCYPVNYTAVFRDSMGDLNNKLISDADVVVENQLITRDIEGHKTWDIDGDETPGDPFLKLTRYVILPGEEKSEPEAIIDELDGTVVYRQPVWSGEGMTRTYRYTGLADKDKDGNPYHYEVAETVFTIGTGNDAVIYTTVKTDEGYTVTANKDGAETFIVTQNDLDIVNGTLKTTVRILKIDESTRDAMFPTTLSEARFRLLVYDGSAYAAYDGDYGAETGAAVGDDGTLEFTNLKDGEYKIVETHTPGGYIKIEDNDIFFKIDGSVLTRYDSAVGTEGRAEIPATIIVHEGDDPVTNVVAGVSYVTEPDLALIVFTVGNNPGAELPASGGPGTTLLTILGIMLMAFAGAGMLVMKSRRRAA